MKYFYKIMRIFFCPHKWKYIHERKIIDDYSGTWHVKVCQCNYCGKWKQFKS